MGHTVVVLYRGALAYYAVTIVHNDAYEAGLLKYCGSSHDLPPSKLSFKIEGRHCQGSTHEQDLMDDLYFAALRKLQQEDNTGFISGTVKPHTTN
jgi:hypothetical protein